jgi:hypothetical protein
MSKLTPAARARLPSRGFAFPAQRKEPLENASHVRNAVARFGQVQGASVAERNEAWQRIRTAARRFGGHLRNGSWRDQLHGRGRSTVCRSGV